MSDKSTRKSRPSKSASDRPKKPYTGFPLSPHPSGKWQKNIRGRIYYFGRWMRIVNGKPERIPGDGWEEALALYKAQADDLHAGRTPRVPGKAVTVKIACNKFLNAKLERLNSGEISPRTFTEYRSTTDRLVGKFGERYVDDLAAEDFESLRSAIAKQYGPHRIGSEILKVKTVFKYAYEAGLIDKPVRYGPQFVRPSKTVMRKHRAAQGQKLFTGKEVRTLLDGAGVPLKAMILLGINCGFGNSDCGSLPISAIDLEAGWITFPRPKTGIARKAKLWPETVKALRDAITERPVPKHAEDADAVFVTKYGRRWVRSFLREPSDIAPVHTPIDAVGLEFRKLARKLKITQTAFYALRHTFRTVADATKDFPAIRMVMGHSDHGIDDAYVEGIDDDRLIAVAEYVRKWLPPSPSPEKKTEGGE